jgi:phytoene dehydrogenase-like protein
MPKYNTIILGGGLGGLTAGATFLNNQMIFDK